MFEDTYAMIFIKIQENWARKKFQNFFTCDFNAHHACSIEYSDASEI